MPTFHEVTFTDGAGETTDITFNMPATRPDGQLFIMHLTKDDTTTAVEPTLTGWTKLEFRSDANTHSSLLSYRVGSSEPATYATTGGDLEYYKVAVYRFSNYSGVPAHLGSNANSASATAPAIAAAAADSLMLRLYSIEADDPGDVPPSGHTSLLYDGGSAGVLEPMIAGATDDTLGATDAATWGGTYFDNWVAWTVEILAGVASPSHGLLTLGVG